MRINKDRGKSIRSSIKAADEQIVLMNELSEEMALLRCWLDELQEDEHDNPASCDAEREKWGKNIPAGRMDSIERMLNSLTNIRHLMEEVQKSLRLSSPDAMKPAMHHDAWEAPVALAEF